VTVFDKSSARNSLRVLDRCVKAGIPAEVYLGSDKLAKQFRFADKKQIPFVLVQGSDELANSEITVRRMATGKQKTVPIDQLPAYLKGYYEAR
jgi:histidyl-tRNA synthetase